MHKLDDPKLLEQCRRIKSMIAQVAQDSKHHDDYQAKQYHHWKLSPPVKLAEIEQFEQYTGVTLPTEYVYYLTQVGRGGACPGTIIHDFNAEIGKKEDTLKLVPESLCEVMTEEEWKEKFADEGFCEDGAKHICDMDSTYLAYLIISGPLAGRMVYLDYTGCAPMWPKGCPDFLTWCEEFYSELLAGYDINPTWKFMWMQHGDVADLINAFENEPIIENKKDILLSFSKFSTLSQESLDFFKSITDSEFQETIETIMKYFEEKSKK